MLDCMLLLKAKSNSLTKHLGTHLLSYWLLVKVGMEIADKASGHSSA